MFLNRLHGTVKGAEPGSQMSSRYLMKDLGRLYCTIACGSSWHIGDLMLITDDFSEWRAWVSGAVRRRVGGAHTDQHENVLLR